MIQDNLLLEFGANAVVEQPCYELQLSMVGVNNKYAKASNLCGYFYFQSIIDARMFIIKAMKYLDEYFDKTLRYNVILWDNKNEERGGFIRIFNSENECDVITGRFLKKETIKVYSFA